MERNFCCVRKVELYEGDSGGLGSPIGYIDVIDGTETKEGWDEIEDRRDGGMDSKEPHVMELLEDAREKR